MLDILSFQLVSQLLINGILFGTMYGIAAIGLSLIYGTMRIIFLAQGTIIIFLAYICYWFFKLLGLTLTSPSFLSFQYLCSSDGILSGPFQRSGRLRGQKYLPLDRRRADVPCRESDGNDVEFQPQIDHDKLHGLRVSTLGLRISFTRLMGFIMAVLSTIASTFF